MRSGTFANWLKNVAAVGRAAGSSSRAASNTSIKDRLTPGIGVIGLPATSTSCSSEVGVKSTVRGGCPANRAYSVAAREKTSPDSVAGCNRNTSGGAQAGLTHSDPAASSSAPSTAASPKSASRGLPWLSIRMLAGLTSRCSTPDAWAAANASAIWRPTCRTLSSLGRFSGLSHLVNDPPGHSSMTR